MTSPTKLPQQLENPLDFLLARLAILLVPLIKSLNVTPNMVTLLGGVVRAMALVSFHKSQTTTAMLLWTLGYMADIIDGILARSTDQVTAFGCVLDHGNDTLSFCGLMALCGLRVYQGKAAWPLLVGLVLSALSMQHMLCQEDYMHRQEDSLKSNNNGNAATQKPYQQIEMLKALPWTCDGNKSLPWSRFFGVGTAQLYYLFLIKYYA